MIKYVYNEKEYSNLYQLRRENRNLVFSNSSPEKLLNNLGITKIEVPDPVFEEPEKEPEEPIEEAE